MNKQFIVQWMLQLLEKDGCLYQDDIVDYLVRSNREDFLRENADGNLVLGQAILKEFRSLTEYDVVWVRPERYWRFRVPEDELGREARG